MDCVLAHGVSQMRTFSMVEDVAALLPNIVAFFPQLTHITLNALHGGSADCLQDLDALSSLTLIDVELHAFVEAISGAEVVGPRIRTLGIDAKSNPIVHCADEFKYTNYNICLQARVFPSTLTWCLHSSPT